MHPYHIKLLQELQPPDFEKRRNFCTWFKDQSGDNAKELLIILLQMRHGFTCLTMLIVKTIESGQRIMQTCFNKQVYSLRKLAFAQSQNIMLLD